MLNKGGREVNIRRPDPRGIYHAEPSRVDCDSRFLIPDSRSLCSSHTHCLPTYLRPACVPTYYFTLLPTTYLAQPSTYVDARDWSHHRLHNLQLPTDVPQARAFPAHPKIIIFSLRLAFVTLPLPTCLPRCLGKVSHELATFAQAALYLDVLHQESANHVHSHPSPKHDLLSPSIRVGPICGPGTTISRAKSAW